MLLFLVALEVTTDWGTRSDVTASSHAPECKEMSVVIITELHTIIMNMIYHCYLSFHA